MGNVRINYMNKKHIDYNFKKNRIWDLMVQNWKWTMYGYKNVENIATQIKMWYFLKYSWTVISFVLFGTLVGGTNCEISPGLERNSLNPFGVFYLLKKCPEFTFYQVSLIDNSQTICVFDKQ